ncbi:MAG: hypothetical protein ACRC46_11730 [Thermoguttaceae bacterium]
MSHKIISIGFILTHVFAASLFAFPITATLRSEASVRSGPGEEFYETLRLQAGDAVQVYAIGETDWCEIRPPIGSFSWVSGEALRVGHDGIGVVTADTAIVRVGSELTDLCSAIQVSLRQDEKVRVIDRVRVEGDAANPVWYKIAPPRGEFRYIHKSFLDVAVTPMRLPPSDIVPVSYETTTVATTPDVVFTPAPQRPFAEMLRELRDEATLAMRQPTEDWVFETLHQQAERLLEDAPTEIDRQQVQQLVVALSKTQMVRKELSQRRALAQMGSASQARAATPALRSLETSPATAMLPVGYRTALPTVPVTTPATIPTPVTAPSSLPSTWPSANVPTAQTTSSSPFAVEGTLGRFAPAPPGYPPYAVLDEKRQVVCLVTPQRGVSLEKLVGKRIGLQGTLGVYKTKEGVALRHIGANVASEVLP